MTQLTDPPLVLAPDFVTSKGMRDGLRKAFPASQIGKLPRAGTTLDYVGHAAVTHRLNEVAPDWTFRLDPPYRDKEGVIVGVLGYMTIGGKTIPEVGAVDKRLPDGEAMKQAISDFVRRGAMRFGVALDLWSKEDLQDSAGAPASADTSGTSKAATRSGRRTVQASPTDSDVEVGAPSGHSPAQQTPQETSENAGQGSDVAAPASTELREGGTADPPNVAGAAGNPPPGPSDPAGEELVSAGGPMHGGPSSPVGYDAFTSLGELVSLYGGDRDAVLKAAQALDPEVKSLKSIPPHRVMELMRAKQEAMAE